MNEILAARNALAVCLFRCCHAREHDRAVEVRPVEIKQQRSRAPAIGADDDPVRLKEIPNRRTFAEKLRIARDVEFGLWSRKPTNGPADPTSGSGRDCAFLHDELVAV